MRFYSDVTKKVYDSVENLEAAEREIAEKKAAEEAAKAEAEAKKQQAIAEEKAKKEALAKERGERAKAVEEAIKELNDLRADCAKKIEEKQKNVNEMINSFVKDYGSFHYSYRSSDDMPSISISKYMKPFNAIFDDIFKNF